MSEEYKSNNMVSSNLIEKKSTNAAPTTTHYHDKQNKISEFGEVAGTMKQRLNICQWISLGFLVLVFMFLFGFLIYQWSTWTKERINRYG